MTVLILDNDPQVVDVLSMALGDHGWSVRTADRLADARAHLAAGGITVVLADKFLLPGEDGHDFAFRLRDVWQDLAVIYMTGRDTVRSDTLLRDREWSLSKPFDLARVVSTVRLAHVPAASAA